MPNNACMSELTDAAREEDGDSAETCMHQTYNYLHAAHNESRLLSGQTVETHVLIPLDRSAHVATGAGRRQGMQTPWLRTVTGADVLGSPHVLARGWGMTPSNPENRNLAFSFRKIRFTFAA